MRDDETAVLVEVPIWILSELRELSRLTGKSCPVLIVAALASEIERLRKSLGDERDWGAETERYQW